jgi:phage terminase small subunit
MTAKQTAESHARTGTGRPDRQRRLPADKRGIGAAPSHLSPGTAAIWKELSLALPAGVGGPCDRAAFEVLCRAFERTRAASPTAAELGQLRLMLDGFGLTPRGRQQLDVMPTKDADGHRNGFDF